MSATTRTPFKLVRATSADIPAIAQIAGDSFETDTHTQLKAHWRGPNAHRDGTAAYLPSLLSNPRAEIIVARLEEDGSRKVVGFVVWMTHVYESVVPERDTSKATTLPPPPPPVTADAPLTIAELEATTNAAMSHYVAHLVPEGTACRYIVMMSVAPAYQGLGVGSALLKWGTEKADADGVFCWVSSSMGGYLVFEKAGFVEVGRQALVLDHYAQGVKTAEGGEWGVYVWRWMRRDPIPA